MGKESDFSKARFQEGAATQGGAWALVQFHPAYSLKTSSGVFR